ncbi:MAG: ParA family protein [Verrucomicrobia bacterium]|nr:ParA family protein [Verrucomicrobiota bacterium]
MQTFTFCSFKGGTSKTSSAMHIGACLAMFHKKKVLLVDFDSQANLSIGLGVGPDTLDTMVPVLQGQSDIKDVIKPTSIKNLFLIPANAYLDGIERTPQLGNDPYAHERLRRALKNVENDFDVCFLDTPPSLGWLTQSAFFASQYSVICAIPEAYSVIALRRLKEFQDSIRQYHDITALGVVFSFWDERGAVNNEFLQEINASFPDKTFEAKVRRDIAVSRAVLKGQTVLEFDKDSRAAEDYKALSKEFVSRLSNEGLENKVNSLLEKNSKTVGANVKA